MIEFRKENMIAPLSVFFSLVSNHGFVQINLIIFHFCCLSFVFWKAIYLYGGGIFFSAGVLIKVNLELGISIWGPRSHTFLKTNIIVDINL